MHNVCKQQGLIKLYVTMKFDLIKTHITMHVHVAINTVNTGFKWYIFRLDKAFTRGRVLI